MDAVQKASSTAGIFMSKQWRFIEASLLLVRLNSRGSVCSSCAFFPQDYSPFANPYTGRQAIGHRGDINQESERCWRMLIKDGIPALSDTPAVDSSSFCSYLKVQSLMLRAELIVLVYFNLSWKLLAILRWLTFCQRLLYLLCLVLRRCRVKRPRNSWPCAY